MPTVKFYVEGGGQKSLDIKLGKAFRSFFSGLKAELRSRGSDLKVVTKGDRDRTYDNFKTALRIAKEGELPVLLVDAEDPIPQSKTCRQHLRDRDGWDVSGFDENQCYLMVIMMESWFYAQKDVVQSCFDKSFRPNLMSSNPDIESLTKDQVEKGLKDATGQCQNGRGRYDKGKHEAKILEKLDAKVVCAKSKHCARIFTEIPKAVAQL